MARLEDLSHESFEPHVGDAFPGTRAADVRLRVAKHLSPGRYDLVVTASDRAGQTTTVRRTVAVR